MADEIYVAKSGADILGPRGERVILRRGHTVRAGHWLLERVPHLFKPQKVTYEVEQKDDQGATASKARKPAAA